MNISNNKILITGGGSGIGLGLTEKFLEENNTVIICGRREDVLNQVREKYPSLIIKQCDLSSVAGRQDLLNGSLPTIPIWMYWLTMPAFKTGWVLRMNIFFNAPRKKLK